LEPRKARGWLAAATLILASATAAASGSGSDERVPLAVQSSPAGAVIIIDGRGTGAVTPATLAVAPGRRRIRMEKRGYKPAERVVEVYTGGGFVSFILQPGDRGPSSSRVNDAAARPVGARPRPASGKSAAAFEKRNTPGRTVPETVPVTRKLKTIQAPEKSPPERREPAAAPKRLPAPAKPARFSYRDAGPEKERENDRPHSWSILPRQNPFRQVIAEAKEESKEKAAQEDKEGVAATLASLNVYKRDVFPLAVKSVKEEAEQDHAETLPEETGDMEELEEIEDQFIDMGDDPYADFETIEEPRVEEAETEAEPPVGPSPEPPAQSTAAGDTAGIQKKAALIPAPEVDWPDSAETALFEAAADLPEFPERFNILILGLDRRDRYGILATGREIPLEKLKRMGGRSDVIMVMQLDFVDNKVRLVSIPRDTQAYIPGRGYRKINSAYALGREGLARRTVERLLDVKIHRTVVVDWRGAKKCIAVFKKLGLDYKGYGEKEMFWYLRKRSFPGGDFTRIERQQRFVRHGLSEFLDLANQVRNSQGMSGAVKKQLVDMAVRQGLEVVDTDLTIEEVKLLLFAFRDYDMNDMTAARLRGRGGRFGAEEDGAGGVYLYKPYRGQTFDKIVARAERSQGRPAPVADHFGPKAASDAR